MTFYDWCCSVKTRYDELVKVADGRYPVTQKLVLQSLRKSFNADYYQVQIFLVSRETLLTLVLCQRWLKDHMITFAFQINRKVVKKGLEIWREDNSNSEQARLTEATMLKGGQKRLRLVYPSTDEATEAYTEGI